MSRFSFESSPLAISSAVTKEGDFRLTVLTERLIRIEKGTFTDEATQTVWNRCFDKVQFHIKKERHIWVLKTDCCQFHIDTKRCSIKKLYINGESVTLGGKSAALPGTARTLDMTNGFVKMGRGLMSRSGVGFLDDSASLVLRQDGKIYPREKTRDIYVFAYGKDYRACMKAFYKLTGMPPLIPKFAFGNWWSRYKSYSQKEYMELMDEFEKRSIPLTVATIDMDWHWTDVKERFGKEAAPTPGKNIQDRLYALINPGWTGYSWNTELFPEWKEFLKWLHEEKRLAVTLNVHPSQGVRFFEDCYPAMCKRMGVSPEGKETIEFDLTDDKFTEAYFDILHHSFEEEGVDFWWIDWQQGKNSKMKGLDPLWALNHYHSLDIARAGKRSIILSRFSGWGSHRYPLGFSGDTICSWKSLALQPFFTASAANAGYTWWSHDIGGHYLGINDDELYVRWLQFGVFSPINRLHSSNNECMGKEPWKRGYVARTVAEKFLQLRHRMIPYIYSVNYLTHTEGRALCEPLYYSYT
ncbi:MAG: alpha-xylosidase, partial [Firmicutes bacterium]|nr:alpha-xylosidase [Bacillota bacterium]